MMNFRDSLLTFIPKATLYLGLLLSAPNLIAASQTSDSSVVRCSNKTNRCVVSLTKGHQGQKIQVLDETARKVGDGVILKRRGKYVLVKITTFTSRIKKNYPVVLLYQNDYCQI